MNRIFIAGTSTDVGKTLACAGLLRALQGKKIKTAVVKLVQSGCTADLTAPDVEMYRCAGISESCELFCFHKYVPACSPHLAAQMAGEEINLQLLAERTKKLYAEYDFVLIEGAGGLMTPLNRRETMLDLLDLLDCGTLLVVDNVLGAINHALLSIEALKARNIPIAGLLMNHSAPPTADTAYIGIENPQIISGLSGIPVLGQLDYISGFDGRDPAQWDIIAKSLETVVERILS